MKISNMVISAAMIVLLGVAGAASAETKKIVNTSTGAGAPMNFPSPTTDTEGNYVPSGGDASGKSTVHTKKKVSHKKTTTHG